MTKPFSGTGVAIITPFTQNNTIDYVALEKLLEHVISGGVDFIVALGSTGEASTLNHQEKGELVHWIKKRIQHRTKLMIGFGGNATREILQHLSEFDFDGIDAILSVAPYYNKPPQSGIIAHFSAIADISPVPVVMYNIKSRSAVNIETETVLTLSQHPNIIGIKEASGNYCQISDIINRSPSDFLVLSGDDESTLPLLALGADGVISVTANAYPAKFSTMLKLAQQNDIQAAATLHYQLLEMFRLLFKEGSPAGIKALLSIMQLSENILRLPLEPVSPSLFSEIKQLSLRMF